MLRRRGKTLLDRVLDLPWLLVAHVRHVGAEVRCRLPVVLDVVLRPAKLSGAKRVLASAGRRPLVALADLVWGLPAVLGHLRFRRLAPRAFALVGTPIATVVLVLVLVIASQAPTIVEASSGGQGVLALAVVEEPAAPALPAEATAAPARKAAPARHRSNRSTTTRLRATAAPTAASRKWTPVSQPEAAPQPRAASSKPVTRRIAPKSPPRAKPTAPAPGDRPRRRKGSAGGGGGGGGGDGGGGAGGGGDGGGGGAGGGGGGDDEGGGDDDGRGDRGDDGGGGGGDDEDDDDRGRGDDDDRGDRDRDRDRDRDKDKGDKDDSRDGDDD